MVAAAFASACMMFLSFADWDIWPFGFVFFVPLMYLADRAANTRKAFLWAWAAGWMANYGGFYWITGLLEDFGHMPLWIALPICLLLNAYQGLSFGVFGALFHFLRKKGAAAVWLAPLCWLALELWMPLIFPYYMGNSQWTFPAMIQILELVGPLGIAAVLFTMNGALYDLLDTYVLAPERARWGKVFAAVPRRRVLIGLGVATALVAANIVYGYVRMGQVDAQAAAAQKLKIGAVEADIGIWEKERPDKLENNLHIHQRLSRKLAAEGAELIVWPESSFQAPFVFASREKTDDLEKLAQTTDQYRRYIPKDATWLRPSQAEPVDSAADDIRANTSLPDRHGVQRGFAVPTLFGGITFRTLSEQELRDDPPHKKMRRVIDKKIVSVPRPYRVSNTATLLDGQGRVLGMYDKTYLLAFGEYIPAADLWPWVYDLIPEASEFTPGDSIEVFELDGHRLGVMICYEDIIPRFGVAVAEQDPHVLINVTNDAWFGKTAEPYLHLALATFRSVETRKWLLRSTNTGVTAFVDANGRVVKSTSIYEPETLLAEVPMLTGGPTPYVWMGKLGRSLVPESAPRVIRDTVASAFSDWIGVCCLVGVVVLVVRRRRENAA
jgi:apolipoprotein N-acyltransferase